MAAWIVCALCALVIIKPQEFVDELSGTPILYVLFGIAAVLIALDVTWRRLRPSLSPQVPWVLAFLAWSALTTAIKRPDALVDRGTAVTIVGVIFLTVAVGAGSARGVRALGATIVICATLVCGVTLAQGAAPLTCMVPRDPDDWDSTGELSPDGRPCETSADCLKGAIDFRFRHRCERPGPLGTSSIGGRVRYRGSLGDPNEVSLMICACLPLAFAYTGGGGAALPRRGREGRGKRPPAGAPRGAGGAFVRSL
ncbi:MAG: O-antigen ligase domain-containing protein, partial [Polyangiaceae bacterium]|nr:O-antigen ligase domain-containing protein [Polyangiaceae bacterium]